MRCHRHIGLQVFERKLYGGLQSASTKSYHTRGHEWKLKKKSSRISNLKSNFYLIRIVNLWNSSPEEVVGAPSVNALRVGLTSFVKKTDSV